MNPRIILVSATILATSLLLVGCSVVGMGAGSSTPASSSPTAASTSAHNAPDVTFATNMIAHHQQAIQMADMVLAKQGTDPRVVTLAKNIKKAQDPEIATMTAWLMNWGQPTDMAGMPGMSMNGLMSETDMKALDAASGADASKLSLSQMTQHHQGAIDMANEEGSTGLNADAIALAKRIVGDQTAEIATMKALLAAM